MKSSNNFYEDFLAQSAASEKAADMRAARLLNALNGGFENTTKATSMAAGRVIESVKENAKETTEAVNKCTKQEADRVIAEVSTDTSLSSIDWLLIVLFTTLGGIAGWFFSRCMINHGFSAWVHTSTTQKLVRDANGNFVDFVTTSSQTTVWPTVILTIVLMAIVACMVTMAFVSNKKRR